MDWRIGIKIFQIRNDSAIITNIRQETPDALSPGNVNNCYDGKLSSPWSLAVNWIFVPGHTIHPWMS
ncbi:MAG: hypothetical protein V7K57_04670 [Nostoc sp.]|uniref:hypothetical protein n=1 Tax=Nostoc sp. TaxID=1180 RepID=UPI002FF88EF3